MSVRAEDILCFLEESSYKVKIDGNRNIEIQGFCSLNAPQSHCVTWVKNAEEHSLDGFEGCSDCIVIAKNIIGNPINNVCFLVTEEPKAVFFSILGHFWQKKIQRGIASTAVVESDNIAVDVSIGHHCYIGRDVSIGSGTIIEHNVSIYNKVSIGQNCYIHSGTVIGSDGFGFFLDHEGIPNKVEHYGGVRIGDEVEIGANNTIARGTLDDTIIDSFSKTDNLCHIAHNCRIGKKVMLTANSVMAGSVTLKDGGYLGPGSIIKNQLTLEENAFVGIGGVVLKNVEPDTVVAGVPAKAMRKVMAGDK